MPCKRDSLSIGTLLGNLKGVRLPELLREKKKYIWVPFLEPEVIKILNLSEALTSLEHTYLGSLFWTQRILGK
jgi:RNase P/RNase MRP subunit POP5